MARIWATCRWLISLTVLVGWLMGPAQVDDASLPIRPDPHWATDPYYFPPLAWAEPAAPDPHPLVAEGRARAFAVVSRRRKLHDLLWLHGVGTQLYTAWNQPMTLRAVNWYGFEYAPFVPDGLDRAPLDSILGLVRNAGFNALRLMFADETVRSNPIVWKGLAANPALRGKHTLDIMGYVLWRAHHFGLRVILCNSRSEAGRGPELKTGLWYSAEYPETVWQQDWMELARRFSRYSAFVGADLRNEPHITGQVFDVPSYFAHGPLWGAFHETYYHDRDWRYAAQTLGNMLLQINPRLLIIVEGVQMYLNPDDNRLEGALWGSNLVGVQYDPVVLTRPSQLVYSIHEYGPKMWMGSWFNAHTTYDSLAERWTHLWGYLLTAPRQMQAPLLVGEFGTCDDHYSCIASPRQIPTSGGFWFSSFIHYLHAHPQVSWAYWALNTTGPFEPYQRDLYALMSPDWKHLEPMILYGLKPLLR